MNANDVAQSIKPHYRDFPLSGYQKMVLQLLHIDTRNVSGYKHALQIFDALGIIVTTSRRGRQHIPVIKILPRVYTQEDGGWNPGGDGWSTRETITFPDVDFSNIMQYVVE